jgi:hypothetical protein
MAPQIIEINLALPSPVLTGRATTEIKRYSSAVSNFKRMPMQRASSAEYILLNYRVGCLCRSQQDFVFILYGAQ